MSRSKSPKTPASALPASRIDALADKVFDFLQPLLDAPPYAVCIQVEPGRSRRVKYTDPVQFLQDDVPSALAHVLQGEIADGARLRVQLLSEDGGYQDDIRFDVREEKVSKDKESTAVIEYGPVNQPAAAAAAVVLQGVYDVGRDLVSAVGRAADREGQAREKAFDRLERAYNKIEQLQEENGQLRAELSSAKVIRGFENEPWYAKLVDKDLVADAMRIGAGFLLERMKTDGKAAPKGSEGSEKTAGSAQGGGERGAWRADLDMLLDAVEKGDMPPDMAAGILKMKMADTTGPAAEFFACLVKP